MSDINQDDIDKLLQDALAGADDDATPAGAPAAEAAPSQPLPELGGAASQDDIDALFAAVGSDDFGGQKQPASVPSPEMETVEEPPPDQSESDGPANQDDIDALFSAVDENNDATPPAPAKAAIAKPEPEAAGDDDIAGSASQDDIDALFSAVGGESDAAPADAGDDGASLFESQIAEAEAVAEQEKTEADSDLNELLSSIVGENEEPPPAEPVDNAATTAILGADLAMADMENTDTAIVPDDVDIDALLREVEQAVPPPPPRSLPQTVSAADTAVLGPDVSSALANLEAESAVSSHTVGDYTPKLSSRPPQPAPPPPAPAVSAPAPAPAAPAGCREFSVLYGAGEVESVANQIVSLINTMSEKANGYMQAWIAADSEAKELRSRALAEERRQSSLASEKIALSKQLDELRGRLSEIEGAKIASDESRRTLETAHHSKTRELESQVTLLSSEAETLKNELTRALNQATGIDIESRRARFEVDRLKNEVESERMERLRMQRALENREKELQAMQSQSSGQASSLFIDELHRLVRRLESELDARTSGAHEALKQLDRLDAPAEMVPVVANIRAALMQAVGQDADADDALKSLGREASGVKGPAAVAPARAEMISFETALSTFNLVGAVEVAGALLREVSATPGSLMRKIYQCPALRRPEVVEHVIDLSRLLEGLRTVQESTDRTRGSETGESEVFYVHMFDFLHNLVRLKLVNRLSGDIWRLFLDLRGRFSFVTSDKQWAEYRDKTLKNP